MLISYYHRIHSGTFLPNRGICTITDDDFGSNGDPVRIEAHVGGGTKGKGKKKVEDDESAVEGIIYRVSSVRSSREES
jgi:hypothetical protein